MSSLVGPCIRTTAKHALYAIESTTMLKVSPGAASLSGPDEGNSITHFLAFPALCLRDFFKALNFTVFPHTIEQVTCKYRLFYKSDGLNWGLLPLNSQAKLASCLPQHPFSPNSLIKEGALVCWGGNVCRLMLTFPSISGS